MLHSVDLVADVSEEYIASITRVKRMRNLAEYFTLIMEAINSPEPSTPTRVTQCHNLEDDILHSGLFRSQ
jgi:hypothetical protein